ncbi:HD domain-containing protein [candidate division GN15 bacterium]|nr:HD domain-containing protein [candidate division GN15 bacterium]
MLDSVIAKRLTELLDDSRVRREIVEEMSALCAQKPPEMSIEAFGHEVARLILLQLHDRLRDECDHQLGRDSAPRAADPDHSPQHPIDFEYVLSGLLKGAEHDMLIGNLQMVRALGGAIAQRDTGTSEHNARVTLSSQRLGRAAGLNRHELRALMKGSFVHDIGKIGIPDHILRKADRLTGAEATEMRSHVVRGCEIIDGVRWLDEARPVVRHHHEKYDGSGYPDHLQHDNIPLAARIFAIADVFDALSSERPYKPASSYEETMHTIVAERGRHFDPGLLDTFVEMSREVYDDITCRSLDELDRMVVTDITEVFGVNPSSDVIATEEFKRRFARQ